MISNIQSNHWQSLAEAIREELRECAWLLSLLDDQQKAILGRDNGALLKVNEAIEEQTHSLALCNRRRIDLMLAASRSQILVPGSTIMDLAPDMPQAMKPLFEALSLEAASLRERVNRRSRQNRRLLERASGVVNELLGVVRPGSITRTYGRKGRFQTYSSLKGSVVSTAV
ncbi:MAG: flagellar export chaperone FlgN [Opitutales bacterium]|nr:flagellar export chaperone FlgN [Opitutales bacterium]